VVSRICFGSDTPGRLTLDGRAAFAQAFCHVAFSIVGWQITFVSF
jgi:hypothetical protein